MRRCVTSVATTDQFQRGLRRIHDTFTAQGVEARCWSELPPGSPTHQESQYAFKLCALDLAAKEGFDTLLWCDSCIVPIRDVTPLCEHIEREGYWIALNGWTNDIWTADSAYPALFPEFDGPNGYDLEGARSANSKIPHTVATTFGLSMRHPIGQALLAEMLRLGTTTNAFNGPSWNTNNTEFRHPNNHRCGPCGPPHVRGHRQDQVALSVQSWRMNLDLTPCPKFFSYYGGQREDTVILADGAFQWNP